MQHKYRINKRNELNWDLEEWIPPQEGRGVNKGKILKGRWATKGHYNTFIIALQAFVTRQAEDMLADSGVYTPGDAEAFLAAWSGAIEEARGQVRDVAQGAS